MGGWEKKAVSSGPVLVVGRARGGASSEVAAAGERELTNYTLTKESLKTRKSASNHEKNKELEEKKERKKNKKTRAAQTEVMRQTRCHSPNQHLVRQVSERGRQAGSRLQFPPQRITPRRGALFGPGGDCSSLFGAGGLN